MNIIYIFKCMDTTNMTGIQNGSQLEPSGHDHSREVRLERLPYDNLKKNKRSKDLGALLDSCSWDDIGNFLQTRCCRLNQLKSGLTLPQYLTMHVSILDHIRHLNFDLSGSLKVKCEWYWTPHTWFAINV